MSSPLVGGARVELLCDAGVFGVEADRELAAAGKVAAASWDKSFVPAIESSMAEAGAVAGEVFYKGADGRLRTAQGKFVSRGRAAAAGYTDAVVAGMATGTPKVAEAGAAQGRAASGAFATQGAKAGEGFMSKLSAVLLGKHAITAAVFAGIGYEAVKMAGDFQTGMVRLVTAAGESQANLAEVSRGTLQISRDTGVGTHELAAGMYMVESAGFHGTRGLEVMRAAAEGAKVDMADANVVANALTTVLTDMGTKAGPPAAMMSKLVATVGHGKMTMDEFAGSIHSVLPNAAAIGLSFEQVAGAVATMTAQGITAQQATQNLNHAILALVNPTAVQTKAMAAFGLNATDVAKSLGARGLTGTLDILQHTILAHMGPAGLTMEKTLNSSVVAADKANRMFGTLGPQAQSIAREFMAGKTSLGEFSVAMRTLHGQQAILGRQWLTIYTRAHGFNDLLKSGSPDAMTYSAALAKMTGGQVGLQVALHLTGENMATYKANVHAIGEAHTEAGGHVEGWAIKQKTFNQVMAQLGATMKANMINLGLRLIPILTVIGQVLLRDVFPAMHAVGGAVGSAFSFIAHNDALKVFLGIIGGVVLAMKAWEMATIAYKAAAMGLYYVQTLLDAALTGNPIGLIVVAIAALAAGVVYAYEHFKPFRDIVDTVGRALRTGLLVALHAVQVAVAATAEFIGDHWKLIAGILLVAMGPIVWAIAGVGVAVFLLVTHFHGIVNAAKDLWHSTAGFFSRMWSDVSGFATRIYNDVTGFFTRAYDDVAGAVGATKDAVVGAWNAARDYVVGVFTRMGEDIHRHWRLILFLTTGGLGLIWIVVQDHWKAISGFFSRIYHDVAGFVGRLWADVTGFFNRINQDVTGFTDRTHRHLVGAWSAVWDEVTGFASRIWRDVAGFFSRIWRDVSGFATRIFRDVVGAFTAVNNRIGEINTAIRARLLAIWLSVWHDVTGFASRIWHDVAGFFSRLASDVGGVLSPFWARLRAGWEALFTGTSLVVGRIWHGVTGFFGRMRDDVVRLFGDMVTGVERAWNKVKDVVATPIRWVVDTVYNNGIVKMWNALAGVLHEQGMKLDPVHFAAGGVVPGNRADGDWVPIFATAGEGVLNLQAMQKIGGAAGLAVLNGTNKQAAEGHFGVGGVIGAAVGAVNPFAGLAAGNPQLARGALAASMGPAIRALEGQADSHLNPLGGIGRLLDRGVHQLGDRLLAWVAADDRRASTAAAAGAYGGGDAVMRWKPLVDLVLDMLGRSHGEEGAILARIAFESGGNPNAINLTDCLTLDAMILTRRGWLKHDEVRVGDETIGYNHDTGRSEWTPVTRVVHFDQAPLVRLGNSRWHATVTPNHRWVSQPRISAPRADEQQSCDLCSWPEGTRRRGATTAGGLRIHRAKAHGIAGGPQTDALGATRMVQTQDLNSRDRLILAAVAETGAGLPITDTEAAVLGWLAGDGHVEEGRRGKAMSIAQSKPAMVAKLRSLLADSHVAVYVDERLTRTGKQAIGPRHQFRFTPAYRRDLLGRVGHPKADAPAIVLAMSASQRRAWLDAFIDAEGHRDGGYTSVSQTYGPVLDAAHLAIYLCGYRPRLADNKVTEPGWSPSAHISLGRPVVAASFLRREDAGVGDVWCVTTGLGSWTAEQDGQFFLTGNSNALAGHPSQGLLQTVPDTFYAYAGPYAGRGITDPLANIYAGENYAIHRYGGMPDPRVTHQGYDSGGVLPPGLTLAENNTGRDEHVLTGDLGDQLVHLLTIIAGKSLNMDGRKVTALVEDHRAYQKARLT